MKGSLIIILIFLLLVLLGGGAYFFVPEFKTIVDENIPSLDIGPLFSGNPSLTPVNTNSPTGQGISTEEFQATLGRLQTVEAQLGDQSILNDSRFTSLIDFSVEPRPEPVGNKAPFLAPPKGLGGGRP